MASIAADARNVPEVNAPDLHRSKLEAVIKVGAKEKGLIGEKQRLRWSPGIIPPMLGKTSIAKVIAHQWEAAVQAVSEARQIWIIGYSFPVTDAFMSRLLTEGLRRNADFQQLVVIDRQPRGSHAINQLLAPRLRESRFLYSDVGAESAYSVMSQESVREWPLAVR